MNQLFERVPFDACPLIWTHRGRTTSGFTDYYHWHQCCEMLVIHEGSGSIIFDQKMYSIQRGMVFFFQPFQLHKVHAELSAQVPYVRSILHFDPIAFNAAVSRFPALYARFLQLWKGSGQELAMDAGSVFGYLEQAMDIHLRSEQLVPPGTGADLTECRTLLLLDLLKGLALLAGPDAVRQAPPRELSYCEQIMHWIEEHYTEEIKLENIAEAMHLSKFYVSRLFQAETGSSVMQYLTARRIKAACRLLQTTSLPVEVIGGRIGIANSSYFIRLFKKEVGTTPLKYRNRVASRE